MKFPRLQSESDDLLHLDVVRLSACILVLVHHMRFFFSGHLDRTATASWHLIIEIFFAISGFVIAWVYAERVATPASYLRFMWRRIVRLLPLHLAVLALTGVALVGASSIGLQARSGYDLSAGCVVSTALLTQVYVACSGPHLNYPSWTISVEMLLYAIFPAALLIRRHALILGVAGAVVLVVVFGQTPGGFGEANQAIRGIVSFLFGLGLYHSRAWLVSIPYPRLVLAVSSIAFVVLLSMDSAAALVLPTGYLVVGSAVASDMQRRTSRLVASCARFGQLTYSIYMLHTLVFAIVLGGIGQRLVGASGGALVPWATLALVLVFATSYLSYSTFETPLRKRLGRLGRDARLAPMSVHGRGQATGIGGKMRNW